MPTFRTLKIHTGSGMLMHITILDLCQQRKKEEQLKMAYCFCFCLSQCLHGNQCIFICVTEQAGEIKGI